MSGKQEEARLEPCPWCGKEPHKTFSGGDEIAYCGTDDCPLEGHPFYLPDWNRRAALRSPRPLGALEDAAIRYAPVSALLKEGDGSAVPASPTAAPSLQIGKFTVSKGLGGIHLVKPDGEGGGFNEEKLEKHLEEFYDREF